MSALKFLTFAALSTAALLSLSAQDAHACSCIFTCKNSIIVDQKLPAGAEGIYWFLAGGGRTPDQLGANAITLERLDEQGSYQRVEHELTYSHPAGTVHLIKPKDGFQEGQKYRLTTDLDGWDSGCQVEVETGQVPTQRTAEIEIVNVTPANTLTTTLTEPKQERIAFESDASCQETRDAVYSDLTIVLPAELEGLARSLHYEVLVDDEPYTYIYDSCSFQDSEPGSLDQGRLATRLAALCEEVPDYVGNGALSPGQHTVSVGAYLPESKIFKWSSAQTTINLDCAKAPEDMGHEPADMGADMRPPQADMPPSGEDMSPSSPTPSPQDEGGCAQSGAHAPSPALILMGALFALGLFRPRRQTTKA